MSGFFLFFKHNVSNNDITSYALYSNKLCYSIYLLEYVWQVHYYVCVYSLEIISLEMKYFGKKKTSTILLHCIYIYTNTIVCTYLHVITVQHAESNDNIIFTEIWWDFTGHLLYILKKLSSAKNSSGRRSVVGRTHKLTVSTRNRFVHYNTCIIL